MCNLYSVTTNQEAIRVLLRVILGNPRKSLELPGTLFSLWDGRSQGLTAYLS